MIIFLYGTDTYRLKQRIDELRDKFIGKVDNLGLNVIHLDGEKLETEEFRKAAFSSGFLSAKRLVIVENLLGRGRKPTVQKEILECLRGMKGGENENAIIFAEAADMRQAADGGKKAKGGELFAFLKKTKYAQEFLPLSGYQLNAWIAKEIAVRGGRITPAAAALLADSTGGDLWRLSNEIGKLTAHAGSRAINKEDVELLVKGKIDDNIFNLADAMGNRNAKLAVRLLKDQLEAGSSWSYLLSMLVRQFRILLQIEDALRRGASLSGLPVKLGLHPFVVKKAAAQIGRYQPGELKSIYRQLLEIDVSLKTSPTDAEALFDLLAVGTR